VQLTISLALDINSPVRLLYEISELFLGFLDTKITSNPLFNKTCFTAFDAPPVPKIKAKPFFSSHTDNSDFSKPKASVLYPIKLPFSIFTVLTAPIDLASSLNLSKKGK